MIHFLARPFKAVVLTLGMVSTSFAADQDEALKAANDILTSIQSKTFEKLWNAQTSNFFKSKTTKDSFFANMAMGRAQVGSAGQSKFLDMAYSKEDPGTGYKGEIYSFNFLNSYTVGKFYERIVVIKETDGKFRLAGLWGAPAPK